MTPIITFGDYSYAAPPASQDKLATVKYLLQKEIDVGTNLLRDLDTQLPNINEVSELVVLLKVAKDSHGLLKH